MLSKAPPLSPVFTGGSDADPGAEEGIYPRLYCLEAGKGRAGYPLSLPL